MAQKERDPLERLLAGEKLTEIVHTRRGDFTLVFPLPSTLRQIELDVADALGGRPQTAFGQDHIANIRAYCTLRYVVETGPEWWNDLESPEQCPDNDITGELYRRYLQLYTKTQRSMAQGRYRGDVGKVRLADPSKTPPVAGESVQGATDGPEVPSAQ